MTKLRVFGQRVLRRFLQLFSLGTVMFIMEACYGPITDGYYNDLITLRVVNLDGEPIGGIEVYLYVPDAADKRGTQVGQTSTDGTVTLNLGEYVDGSKMQCTLWLVDADGAKNGGTYASKSVYVNGYNAVVTTAMSEQ